MRRLAIETAGRACSIALFEGERLIASRHELIGRGHAEALVPWIADLPDGGRCDTILVGCGPGSFTGVRIGVAAARALGLGWGVPVMGFSSLALVAASYLDHVRSGRNHPPTREMVQTQDALAVIPFLVAVEGGHGELFIQSFAPAPVQPVSAPRSLSPDDAAALDLPFVVVGSGAARLVAARGRGQAEPLDACAANIHLIDSDERCGPPVPVYGRNADARPMA